MEIITPPARRAWRSYKFGGFCFIFFFGCRKVGLPLMGDTAVHTAVWARVTTAFELNF